MKTSISITFATLILLFSANAIATEQQPDYCRMIHDAAETIMEKRQESVPLVEIMDIVEGHDVFTSIAIDAYNVPVRSTKAGRQMTVNTFAEDYYLFCLETRESI